MSDEVKHDGSDHFYAENFTDFKGWGPTVKQENEAIERLTQERDTAMDLVRTLTEKTRTLTGEMIVLRHQRISTLTRERDEARTLVIDLRRERAEAEKVALEYKEYRDLSVDEFALVLKRAEKAEDELKQARQQRDQVKLLYTLVDSDLPFDFQIDLPPYERICAYVERCEQAEAERDELQRLFDLQWTRSKEADARWKAAHPESDVVKVDLGELLTWLMASMDAYRLQLDQVRKETDVLRGITAKSDLPCVYCGLEKAEMGRCKSGFPGCARADDLAGGE